MIFFFFESTKNLFFHTNRNINNSEHHIRFYFTFKMIIISPSDSH
jgi:hypothetical protein